MNRLRLLLTIMIFCFSSVNSFEFEWIFFERGNVIIRRSCILQTEHMLVGDLLSWYQLKDSKEVLLQRMQHTDDRSTSINLTLVWTLEQTDKDTQIYCVRDSTSHDGNIFSTGRKNKFEISFSRSIKPRERSYVTVTPDTSSAYFDANTTRSFICKGSLPIDGQQLTWYIQGPGSKLQLAGIQTFDSSTDVNILEMNLDETYHGKRLFFAQDFHLQRLPNKNGTIIIDRYRELAKSNMIELVLAKEEPVINEGEKKGNNVDQKQIRNYTNFEEDGERVEKDDKSKSLSIAQILVITVAVIAMVAVVFLPAVWFHRRAKPEDGEWTEDNSGFDYSTTEATNPVLEISAVIPGPSTKLENNQSRGCTAVTSQATPIDSAASPELTYAALEFARPSAENSKFKINQSCDYATIMTSQTPYRQDR